MSIRARTGTIEAAGQADRRAGGQAGGAMDGRALGIALAGVGLGLLVLGILIWAGALGWFGRLPGDVRIERDGFRVYVPIVSMLVVSVVLSLIFWLIRRLS